MNIKKIKAIAKKEYERDKDILLLGYKRAIKEEIKFLKKIEFNGGLEKEIMIFNRIMELKKKLKKKLKIEDKEKK